AELPEEARDRAAEDPQDLLELGRRAREEIDPQGVLEAAQALGGLVLQFGVRVPEPLEVREDGLRVPAQHVVERLLRPGHLARLERLVGGLGAQLRTEIQRRELALRLLGLALEEHLAAGRQQLVEVGLEVARELLFASLVRSRGRGAGGLRAQGLERL